MILAIFAGIALAGAVLMLMLREPMRVALALITTMGALGAIYGLLGVHFIAAFQVLIYVGAVMVFMVFVIMLLEVREAPGSQRYSQLVVPGTAIFTVLCGALVLSVWRGVGVTSSTPATGSFGLAQFSKTFLSEYWLEFELTSVLLVVAIVAALAVIRTSRQPHG